MPADLSREVAVVLAITAAALVLFVWNRLAVEVVGLVVLVALLTTGLITRDVALSGFANEATVTVALMLALSIGLLRTGAIDGVGRWIGRLAGKSEGRLLLVVILLVIPTSALLNNTAVVAILVPTIIALTREAGTHASRILMPLSFASQMGGTLTLIGTSTNLLVAGLVLDLGGERIRLFDMTLPALLLAGVGVVYLLTVGRWLTPSREPEADLLKQYELRDYLTGLVVEPGSRLSGSSLAESRFGEEYGLNVIMVEREGMRIRPSGSTVLRDGDLLLVQGKIPDIAQIEDTEGLSISGSTPPLTSAPSADAEAEQGGQSDDWALAEIMVPPRSHLAGRTLKELTFRTRFGVSALALQRHGHVVPDRPGRTPLQVGDILLVQGTMESIRALHDGHELSVLGSIEVPAKRRQKRRLAVGIMAGVVLLPALNLTPIVVSALAGVTLMLLTGCMKAQEVYEELDWSVIILLGAILPLGIAMQDTGASQLLAGGMLTMTESLGPRGVLAAFYVLTIGLTAMISNAAAAAVLTPMAVATGAALGVSPLPFVIAVMFGASNSYVTPIGYQTNLFVYGAGGYKFSDFARVGGPLTILTTIAATYIIPLFFPFDAS